MEFLNDFETSDYTVEIQSNKHLKISQDIYEKYETIIIKSSTGSGKTFNTSINVEEYIKKHKDIKFLSLVDLRTLSNQHSLNFKNIDMKNYQTENFEDLKDNNFNICINSLFKFDKKFDFSNYIIYIDEINSFLKTLTHSDLLASNIKIIYTTLMRMIKTCHKLILSDAKVNNKIRKFINKRNKKTIFINNQFKKYENIEAINYKNEEDFLNELIKNIENRKYFLFGSDSCKKATYFHNYLKDKFKDLENDFLLITRESGYKPKDSQEEFKNKFVFHSPSIKTGVDFSIDTKQDVFLYFNQKSVDSDDFFQISTRTRNINKLNYFIEDKRNEAKFESLKKINKYFKKITNTNNKLVNIVSINLNKDDEEEIIENTYFDLFCHNEFEKDIYNTNKKFYFEEILKENGFVISRKGETQKLSNVKVIKMKKITDEENEKKIEEYLKCSSENRLLNKKFESLNNNIEILNIAEEDLKDFMFILSDEKLMKDYLNTLCLFKTDDYIKIKNISGVFTTYSIKSIDLIYNKVKLLREFEKKYKIPNLCLDWDNLEFDFDSSLTDKEFETYKHCFRCKKSKPLTKKLLKEFYIQMIDNITGDISIIKKSRVQKDKVRYFDYTFDLNEIQTIFKICNKGIYSEKQIDKYDTTLLKKFDVELIPNKKLTKIEQQNMYLFGKPNINKQDLLQDNIIDDINFVETDLDY